MTARFDRFDPAAGTPEKSRSETRPKIGPKNFSDTWFLRQIGHLAHDERFGPGIGSTFPSVRNVLSVKILTDFRMGLRPPFRRSFRLGRTWSARRNGQAEVGILFRILFVSCFFINVCEIGTKRLSGVRSGVVETRPGGGSRFVIVSQSMNSKGFASI